MKSAETTQQKWDQHIDDHLLCHGYILEALSARYWSCKNWWAISLVKNMNKRKKADTSRSKKDSTVSQKAYKDMKAGWPKKSKPKTKWPPNMEKLLVERPLVLIHLSATFSMGEPLRPASKFAGTLSEDKTSAT